MAVDPLTSGASRTHVQARRLISGGTRGNEQLTAVTGALLIVLLAVIGVTIISLRPLLSVHLFVGMLLLGPVALKLASAGYRFGRYYTSSRSYRLKGPPPIALRLIAPVVVITTVIVFASGVALLLAGPQSRQALLPIHKVSFIVWVAFMALHVLAHLRSLPHALRSEVSNVPHTQPPAGRAGRLIALAGALVGGATVAVLTIPDFAPWFHFHHFHHH